MFCDVLIIGCGPAGSSAAMEASKMGVDTLLVEKKRSIGNPVQCAEFIPKLLLNEINVTRNSIIQETKFIKIYLRGEILAEFNSPGYMLDRSIFDKELTYYASIYGAKILINSYCLSKEGNKVLLNRGNNAFEIYPKVIIGADGPLSTAGEWIDSKNEKFLIGLQYELPLKEQLDYLEIYFEDSISGGYGWLFPKGNIANVGIGVNWAENFDNSHLMRKLNEFSCHLEKVGKIINTPLSITSGLIPAHGPLNKTVESNILLVGDAAGQTHPITGGGIPQAIICGKIAGKVAAQSVKEKNLDILYNYEKMWKKIYGKELNRAKNKRDLWEANWEELDSDLIRNCWPSFREYYD